MRRFGKDKKTRGPICSLWMSQNRSIWIYRDTHYKMSSSYHCWNTACALYAEQLTSWTSITLSSSSTDSLNLSFLFDLNAVWKLKLYFPVNTRGYMLYAIYMYYTRYVQTTSISPFIDIMYNNSYMEKLVEVVG